MSEEEFFNRMINQISKVFDGRIATKMKNIYLKKDKQLNKQKEILDKIKEYITGYESISTMQELDNAENNQNLDEKTFVEMINRYMKVHDKILELLEEIE